MIIYILQKGYTTKTAKGVDELNALSSKGWSFVRAVDKGAKVEKSEPEGNQEDTLACGICGKQYKSEKAYLKHIESCEG